VHARDVVVERVGDEGGQHVLLAFPLDQHGAEDCRSVRDRLGVPPTAPGAVSPDRLRMRTPHQLPAGRRLRQRHRLDAREHLYLPIVPPALQRLLA
jgi:hypothetical protein